MAEKIRAEHKSTIGAAKKYVTEYRWTLNDWNLLYETLYKNEIHTAEFELNGTDSTCKLSLQTAESPLTIEFSDTLNILAMQVTYSIEKIESTKHVYSQPISKRYDYSFKASLLKSSEKFICNHEAWSGDTLNLLVTIVVVKSVVTTKSPNQTAVKTVPEKTDNLSPNILVNFKSMFDRKSLCDVDFVVGVDKFSAHKALLAAQSKVFEAMFVSCMKEQKTNIVEINDTDADVFEEFLNYLYTGEIIDLQPMVEEILAVADFYQVYPLKTTCEELMLSNLCDDNVAQNVIIADKFCCVALRDEALHLLRNTDKLLESILIEEDLETITSLKKILSNTSETN